MPTILVSDVNQSQNENFQCFFSKSYDDNENSSMVAGGNNKVPGATAS